MVGVFPKTRYACAAFAAAAQESMKDACLTSDNDPKPAPFGAFAPNAAQAAIIAVAHRSRLKRGAFRPWLSRLVDLLRAGPVDVHYQGASFRFYHQGSATERGALFNPDYNLEELDFLRAHIPAGGVFVDVGANVGTYALVLACHIGPSGKVIAIEPHPVTHARLAFNNAASGYTQTKLVAAAAGPADGDRTFVEERLAGRLHRRHARARLCRDRQDPQQHAFGTSLNFRQPGSSPSQPGTSLRGRR